LIVFFVLLFVNIMQKPLNTHTFILYSLLRRTILTSRIGSLLSAVLILVGFALPASANSGFYKDFVILTANKGDNSGSTTTYYYTNDGGGGTNPSFNGAGNIGSFDRGRGMLSLGAEANLYSDNSDVIQNVQLQYRVYRENTTSGGLAALNLTNIPGSYGTNNTRWSNTTTNPDLLSGTSGPGRYVLEVRFIGAGTYNNSGGSGSFNISDDNFTNNYKLTFDVTGSVPLTWAGKGTGNDWFSADNWSPNGVPSSTTDVVIPYIVNGNYPNIDISANSPNAIATVRTLRIEPNSTVVGARLSLSGGQLQVYGDFSDSYAGFNHTGGLFVLAGNDQSFDGGNFRDFKVDGGGTKALVSNMLMLSGSTLTFVNGKVTTKYDNVNNFNITLQDGAYIAGESETSYVEGALRATNTLTEGGSGIFGNIGLELFARGGSPGATIVTRVTNRIYTGAGTSTSIRRSFTINPNSNLPDVQSYDMIFHYLDNELNSIPAQNLLLFRSVSGSAPFNGLGKNNNDASAKTLTRTNITGTLNATFTLGNSANPLPVTITSFIAVAQGNDAVLNWATASETNNQGFEVQVSTDGTTFSKLSFLAVNTPNSSTPHSYQYRDVTSGKQGVRYYRLRQLDLDGTESFVGPRAVTFGEGIAQATSLQGYPSPFSSEINLALQTSAAGLATVTVTDGVGRQVRTWQPTLAAGASTLRLAELQSMPAGLYVVQVRYNDGQTQRLKMVKE
jgi:hypothetical protein